MLIYYIVNSEILKTHSEIFFISALYTYLPNGDVSVANQFSYLCSKTKQHVFVENSTGKLDNDAQV